MRRKSLKDFDRQLAQTIGRVCRETRMAQARTQEHVADAIGVGADYYGRIERGQALPSTEVLVAIAETLTIRIDDLLGLGNGLRAKGARKNSPTGDPPALRRLFSRLCNATPRTQDLVLRVLSEIERARGRRERRTDSLGHGK